MKASNRERYTQALEAFSQPPTASGKQLMTAICLMKLEDYQGAQHFYRLSLYSAFSDRMWQLSGYVSRFADALILANQPSLSNRVIEEIEAYKLDRKSGSLLALYAFAISNLITDQDEDARDYVRGILNKPKIKWTFAMGMTIEAIINRNQRNLDLAIGELLLAHQRKAKFGDLRETPEGFACLPAMALARLASARGMVVSVESEYFCQDYLDYLGQQ